LGQRYPRRFKTPAKSGKTALNMGFLPRLVKKHFCLKTGRFTLLST